MNILIHAKELLEITMRSIPECVKKEMVNIEKSLIDRAQKGMRRYEYRPVSEVYNHRDTIHQLLVQEGYNASVWSGTDGTTIKIFW